MIIDLSQPEASSALQPTCDVGSVTQPAWQAVRPCDAASPARSESLRRAVPTALAAAVLAAATSASAASWNGAGIDSFWSNSANWDEGVLPSSSESADFNGNTPFAVDVDTSAQASMLNINSATSYNFNDTGGSIALTSGDIDVLSGSHGIHCDVSLGANGLWTIPSSEELDVSGIVSGSHSLTKAGNGTLTLSGANSYSGGTALTAGTLAVSSESNLGNGSLGFGGNATLNISGTFATSKAIGLASGQNIIEVDSGQTLTVDGVVSGSTGTFTKSGAGTLALTASNTFSADVNLQSGTLRISSGASLGNTAHTLYLLGPGTLQSTNSLTLDQAVNFAGGTVAVSAGKTLTFAGNVAGSGIIAKTGAGTLELAGGSSVGAGNTFNVTGGTLLVNSSLSTARIMVGANGVLAGGGSTAGNATVQALGKISPGNSIGTLTISGNLTNAGTYHCEVSGANADKLSVAGNLDLTGSVLDFDVLAAPTDSAHVIASYGMLTGTFAAVSNLPPEFTLDYAYDDGVSSNHIALVTVMDPPLLHWALEEGGGTNTTEAVSGETNVAFLSGPVVWTNGLVPGSSYAVSVDIDSPASYVDAGTLTTNGTYVSGGDPGYRVLPNHWSITAWVWLPNPQGATGDRVIASSDTTGGAQTWWLFFVRLYNGIQESLGFDFGSSRVDSSLSVPLNQPVFVAILGDSSGAEVGGTTNKHRFAIWDGNNWQTTNGTQFINLRLQGLELGSFNTGTRQFDGVIDDVRIYDRTLTQTELALLASQKPTLFIAPAGADSNSLSWSPDLPGYVLQETLSLSPASWTNSPSGSTNPIVVPAALPMKFYRLFKP